MSIAALQHEIWPPQLALLLTEPRVGTLHRPHQRKLQIMNKSFKQGADVLSNGVSSVMSGLEKTQADVTASMQKTFKTAEELFTFSQGNVEAFVTAGQIWAAGAQDISKTIAAQVQAQFDETVAAAKSFAGVKSVQEVVDLQSELARRAVAKAAAETSRLTDASRKLATEALAPITNRVTLAAEMFNRAA
jgi:phasin family protein